MKNLVALSLLAFAFAPDFAHAGTFPIPGENPVATVSIPDKWESSPYDGGIPFARMAHVKRVPPVASHFGRTWRVENILASLRVF